MTTKPNVGVRAMRKEDVRDVLKLAYEAFPFEEANDLRKLGSREATVERYKSIVGSFTTVGSRHLVAVDKKDKVLGFVAVRPLDDEKGRVSTSVLTMPRIAVARNSRGRGIGQKLLTKVLAFAANQGYGEVMASVPAGLSKWYVEAGWKVSPPGHMYALLEQPHEGDDRMLGEQAPEDMQGNFSPIHLQEPGPAEQGYTLIARAGTGAKSKFITSWVYPVDGDVFRSLWDLVISDLSLVAEIPLTNSAILGTFASKYEGVPEQDMMAFITALDAKMKQSVPAPTP